MKLLVLVSMIFLLIILPMAVAIAGQKTISFTDVLPGGYAEALIDAGMSVDKADISGEAGEWTNVSMENSSSLKILIEPPANLAKGEYSAYLKVTGQLAPSAFTTTVFASKEIVIRINITDNVVEQLKVDLLSIDGDEKTRMIYIKLLMTNEGNVPVAPFLMLNVLSKNCNATQHSQAELPLIKPTSTWQGSIDIPTSLAIGDYVANITIYQKDFVMGRQVRSFTILDKMPAELPQQDDPVKLSSSPFVIIWVVIAGLVIWSFGRYMSKKRKKPE